MAAQPLLPRDEWLKTLVRAYVGASVLLTDSEGRVLIVRANYNQYWSFPGGGVDEGEDPAECAARELKEETGLELPIGDLLAVTWVARGEDEQGPTVNFFFDAGTVPAGTPVRLQEDELDEYRWASVTEAASLVGPRRAQRLRHGLQVRDGKAPAAVLHRFPCPPSPAAGR